MEDKFDHSLVGAFVLLLGAALVAAVLWLAVGWGGQQPSNPYQAFIQESVAGLNVNAPVKYLGVDVGKVSRIELDPRNSQQVRLSFLIDAGTPIKTDSLAVLKTQGLTGIAYVELSGGSAAAPPLLPGADGLAPTIPFKPSLAARLENVLANVLANIDRVSNNVNAVFDEHNRAALRSSLADIASFAEGLSAQKVAIGAGIRDAAQTARLTARAGEQLGPALQDISASASAVQQMAESAQQASAQAGQAAAAAASSVQQIADQTLPELARTLAETQQLAASLRRLSEQTAASPSSLVLGRPQPRPGPGEGPAR